MAQRRPGRPKNRIPSQQISVLLPKPLAKQAAAVARTKGLGLGTWLRQLTIEAVQRSAA
jgi:hypothetical protein